MGSTTKYRKKDIPKLNYGVLHSQMGYSDGVSIVMEQIEEVMTEYMDISKSQILYLVGKSKHKSPRIRHCEVMWHKHKANILANSAFDNGLGGYRSELIEKAINTVKHAIEEWVHERKLDVIIAHNSSHPVNFIMSIALSRYYRDALRKRKRTPKYLLWWHDSHLERERYKHPSPDVRRYLLQGVPGPYVEYILFINSLQFDDAHNYLRELDKKRKGFYDHMLQNHTVVYNTADTLINSVEDLENAEFGKRCEEFLEEYKINKELGKKRLSLSDVVFCLQHTRIVPRKRIDFALRYAYELFDTLKKDGKSKGFVFFISGHSGDEKGNYKQELIKLHKKLSKEYHTKRFMLVFAEDYESEIKFEEMPFIISRLGGISTYFSEIEGFGNNLLEVLSAGLIPAVYTYPVFKKDIAKYKFNVCALDTFEVTKQSIDEMEKVINSDRIKKVRANKNIKILQKHFAHRIIKSKLTRAIIRHRVHK